MSTHCYLFICFFFFLMIRRPPRSTRTDTLFPYTTLFRSFTTAAQAIPSTSHEWSVQHQAWNGGKMDQWLPAHRGADGVNGPYTMGYFGRADIPFHSALAEAFTVCDAYHCSVMGPTRPNRLYRSEARRVGKECVSSVNTGGRRTIKKKNHLALFHHSVDKQHL